MTIIITDAKDAIEMTQSEFNRLSAEYARAFMYYYGTPPTFEDWVRRKEEFKNEKNTLVDYFQRLEDDTQSPRP